MIVKQNKKLHGVNFDQLYEFLKQNHDEANEIRAERVTKTHDPLALVSNTASPLRAYTLQPLPSFNKRGKAKVKTPSVSSSSDNEDNSANSDPVKAMNKAMALITNAFKYHYSTPTNNNLISSSKTKNKQIE